MPPVGAAIGAAATALAGAFAVGAPIAGTNLMATTYAAAALKAAAGVALKQLAVGVALTALSAAMAPKSPGVKAASGLKLSAELGEDAPGSFIVGRTATAGDLVFHGSHGGGGKDHRENYVQVFELSDLPVTRLRRVFVNGEWAALGETETERGFPVEGYRVKGKDRLWVKFYDGTQTEADPELLARFAPPYKQPWSSDMVGRGIAYAIVTANYHEEVHRQRPEVVFELDGIPLYDPRRDSTAGGSGTQRLSDPSTWVFTANPEVIKYNILLGIRDPLTGVFLWGGQGIGQRDLPASNWFAAMNECDREIDGEPQYRAGLEVRINEEPASVIEEMNKADMGDIAEQAGVWTTRAGPPGLPVFGFTDDDIIVTSPEDYDPFPGLDGAYNGVRAKFPDPSSGWRMKDLPARDNAGFLAADGGRLNTADVTYAAVWRGSQGQRLMASALKGARRMRSHVLVLPPEARPLGLLDTVSWTSPRNGYDAKQFEVAGIEDQADGCTALVLREVDPEDYDFGAGDLLPEDPGFTQRPPLGEEVADFSVEPATVLDADGVSRKPAIRLLWSFTESEVDAIRYRVRLAATQEHVPVSGQGSTPEGEAETALLTLGGAPMLFAGETMTFTVFDDVGAGRLIISEGVVGATAYEVQAIPTPTVGRRWSDWLPVTTPNIKLGERDFEQEVIDKIADARDDARDAKDEVNAVKTRVTTVEGAINGLSEEVLGEAAAILAALDGLDGPAIADLTGIAVAGLRRGWAADPTFRAWSGGALGAWDGNGIGSFGSQVTAGSYYGSSIRFNVPTGASGAALFAASDVEGQLPGADPNVEFVVLAGQFRALAGSLAGGIFRAEWKAAGTESWVSGHAFGQTNAIGTLGAQYGIDVDPDRFQSREVIWQKPFAGAAAAVRIAFWAKLSSSSPAVDLRIDYLDMRAASEAEQRAYLANAYADASVQTLRTEITGPAGAIASIATTIRAEFGPAVAQVNSGSFALATDVSAMASAIDSLSATFGDQNLVKNPQFQDGARDSGVAPNWWATWPAGFSVIPQDPTGGSAVSTAPTQFICAVADDGLQHQARAVDRMPVTPGDRIILGVTAAVGGSGAAGTIQLRLEFRAQPGAAPMATFTRTTTIALSDGWVRPTYNPIDVPKGAAEMRLLVRRLSGGTGRLFFTQVSARKGDPVALAEIETLKSVKVDADGAVAAMKTTIGADFGGYEAFVEQTAGAIATAGMAASSYVLRAVAGGGSAGLRLVAWDDEDGAGGAVLVDAPYLIAPGTISAYEAVFAETGANIVPDNQLQSEKSWSNTPQNFALIKTTSSPNASSLGELRWQGSGSGTSTGRQFPVRPGQVLTATCEIGRINGSQHEAKARIIFYDRSGNVVNNALVASTVTTQTSPEAFESRLTVPPGAYAAAWRWEVVSTDGNVRFWAPEIVKRSKGSSLITPDGAFFDMLTAEEAWIGEANIRDLSVGTLKIKAGALGRLLDGARDAEFEVSIEDGWVNVLTVSLPSNMLPAGATAKALIGPATNVLTPPGGGSRTISWRLRVGGVTRWTEDYTYSNSGDQRSQSFMIAAAVSNGDDIQWQMRKESDSVGEVRHVKTYMSVVALFQVA